MKEIFIFSGIEPNKKGTGLLLTKFLKTADEFDIKYSLSYNKTPQNKIIDLLKKIFIFNYLKKLYYISVNLFKEGSDIRNETIIIIHPQTLGLKRTIKLIENNKLVYFYVLENYFFCIKSYNFLDAKNIVCFDCLTDKSSRGIAKNDCKSFPVDYDYEIYKQFTNTLESNISKIVFLTQNTLQEKLLEKHYHQTFNKIRVGMNTDEFVQTENESVQVNIYDCVFHNTLSYAKGISYFISMAFLLNDLYFLIPYSKEEVTIVTKCSCFPSNIDFVKCSWTSGLKEFVINARVVICPSLWSAPIEGALLKSMYYNGKVAVVDSQYSFGQEIPDNVLIRLPASFKEKEAGSLRDLIRNEQYLDSLKMNCKNWIISYLEVNNNDLNSFFKLLAEKQNLE